MIFNIIITQQGEREEEEDTLTQNHRVKMVMMMNLQ